MNLFDENDVDYPLTVSVKRPQEGFDGEGNYEESFVTVVESMNADIQMSLRVRSVVSENGTGISSAMMWIMYCKPPQVISEGDRVSDGSRIFTVDSVGEWGTHTECIMRQCG